MKVEASKVEASTVSVSGRGFSGFRMLFEHCFFCRWPRRGPDLRIYSCSAVFFRYSLGCVLAPLIDSIFSKRFVVPLRLRMYPATDGTATTDLRCHRVADYAFCNCDEPAFVLGRSGLCGRVYCRTGTRRCCLARRGVFVIMVPVPVERYPCHSI